MSNDKYSRRGFPCGRREKGTCLMRKTKIVTAALAIFLSLTACAPVAPAKETDNSTADVQMQTTTQPTKPVTEGEKLQDTITTEKYTLFWEGEKCYMQGHPGNSSNAFEGDALGKAYYPTFSSLSEMQQKLKTGDLAPEEIAELMRYAPKNTNIVEICNINKLYEAMYPENIEVEYIMFTGRAYSYELGNSITGSITYLCQEEYERLYDAQYIHPLGKSGITILSVEQVDDRNAEVLRYDNLSLGIECSHVRYTNKTDHGTQYILELYAEDTLISIKVFGVSNGAYYRVSLHDLEERPSIEWLSSFGLREYVETEVS